MAMVHKGSDRRRSELGEVDGAVRVSGQAVRTGDLVVVYPCDRAPGVVEHGHPCPDGIGDLTSGEGVVPPLPAQLGHDEGVLWTHDHGRGPLHILPDLDQLPVGGEALDALVLSVAHQPPPVVEYTDAVHQTELARLAAGLAPRTHEFAAG